MSVLSRSVAYNNLSGAAKHVGLSQPQLSRIVSRLEKEMHVSLLNRGARRKSGWTPLAHRLAEAYTAADRHLVTEVQRSVGEAHPHHLKVGTLEGLIPLASRFCHYLLKDLKMEIVELDVHDLNRLEELMFKGYFDVIFTSREPGAKHYKYARRLGFQALTKVREGEANTRVLSSYEFASQVEGRRRATGGTPLLVSNSLEVRRGWVHTYGGEAVVPSEVRKTRGNAGKESFVLLIADDDLSPTLWEQMEEFHSFPS